MMTPGCDPDFARSAPVQGRCRRSDSSRRAPQEPARADISRAGRPAVTLRGLLAIASLLACSMAGPLQADDAEQRLRFTDDKQQSRLVEGKILTEAQDGGVLLLGRDGRLWTIEPQQLASREPLPAPFHPESARELGKSLQAELGADFRIELTPHYVICTNTSPLYARWCAALFERLYGAFQSYWKQRGIKLTPPEFPLVAIVFANETEFSRFAERDVGPTIASAKGYYSITSNRMVLFDLTAAGSGAVGSESEIETRLADIPFNVATVVHEATHQIAFNSGLHTRLADNPLWLTEGMAMYFETPDLRSKTGWKTIGALNRTRLSRFREYLKRRPADSLQTLIGSDARFTQAETALDAYAEAWALSYFLIKSKPAAYVNYLTRIAAKPRLVWNSPAERLEDFRESFGDLETLDAEFLQHLQRLRR